MGGEFETAKQEYNNIPRLHDLIFGINNSNRLGVTKAEAAKNR